MIEFLSQGQALRVSGQRPPGEAGVLGSQAEPLRLPRPHRPEERRDPPRRMQAPGQAKRCGEEKPDGAGREARSQTPPSLPGGEKTRTQGIGWRELLKKLREVLIGLEELENLGCRVEAGITIDIRLPEVEAEDCDPSPLRPSRPLDVLRALASIDLDIEDVERLIGLLRVRSLRLIVRALLSLGRASAYQLIRETGLPGSTVYRALKRLREEGLIQEVERLQAGRNGGRRIRVYALNGRWRICPTRLD